MPCQIGLLIVCLFSESDYTDDETFVIAPDKNKKG